MFYIDKFVIFIHNITKISKKMRQVLDLFESSNALVMTKNKRTKTMNPA